MIATATGCVCFTGDKAFVSWAEIFGHDFVRQVTDDIVGAAIMGIYYNPASNKYWRQSAAAGWQPWTKEDIRLQLGARGLGLKPPRGQELSQADHALIMIHETKTVDGVFPAFFRKGEIIWSNQARISTPPRSCCSGRRTIITSGVKVSLGWQNTLNDSSWVSSHIISAGYRTFTISPGGNPVRGLSLFIAGPPNAGKTFLNNAVHKLIFGSAGEATQFLIGQDQFNAFLFSCPIWTVDDAIASTEGRTQTRFSQVVKAITANDEFTMRGMYREGIRMPWTGRLIVTMNDDPESLQMLPSTETNLMDKIMLLRANATNLDFPSDEQILIELPHFTAFLRDMPKDPGIWVGGRFGIKPYHDPDLRQAAEDSQETTSAKELICQWAKCHFGIDGPGATAEEWVEPDKLDLQLQPV